MSKGLKHYPSYVYNPFRIDAKYIRSFKDVDVKTGELEWVKGDLQAHVRIYGEMYDDFYGLSTMALRILGFMFREMRRDIDEVTLNIQLLMVEFKTDNRVGIYKGVLDLLDKEIIARKVGGDKYFINPNKLYSRGRGKWFNRMSELDREKPEIPKIYPKKLGDEKKSNIQGEQLQPQDKDNAGEGEEG